MCCVQAAKTACEPAPRRYKKANGKDYVGAEDPGVQSVSRIYRYYKRYGKATIVMGASCE